MKLHSAFLGGDASRSSLPSLRCTALKPPGDLDCSNGYSNPRYVSMNNGSSGSSTTRAVSCSTSNSSMMTAGTGASSSWLSSAADVAQAIRSIPCFDQLSPAGLFSPAAVPPSAATDLAALARLFQPNSLRTIYPTVQAPATTTLGHHHGLQPFQTPTSVLHHSSSQASHLLSPLLYPNFHQPSGSYPSSPFRCSRPLLPCLDPSFPSGGHIPQFPYLSGITSPKAARQQVNTAANSSSLLERSMSESEGNNVFQFQRPSSPSRYQSVTKFSPRICGGLSAPPGKTRTESLATTLVAPEAKKPRLLPLPPPSAHSTPQTAPQQPFYPSHFTKGTVISLGNGSYKRVEELCCEDFINSASLSSLAIGSSTVVRIEEKTKDAVVLSFCVQDEKVSVEATVEHPFFVIGRGWSSFRPERTLAVYALSCQKLQVGDVLISLTEPPPAPPTPINANASVAQKRPSVLSTTAAPVSAISSTQTNINNNFVVTSAQNSLLNCNSNHRLPSTNGRRVRCSSNAVPPLPPEDVVGVIRNTGQKTGPGKAARQLENVVGRLSQKQNFEPPPLLEKELIRPGNDVIMVTHTTSAGKRAQSEEETRCEDTTIESVTKRPRSS